MYAHQFGAEAYQKLKVECITVWVCYKTSMWKLTITHHTYLCIGAHRGIAQHLPLLFSILWTQNYFKNDEYKNEKVSSETEKDKERKPNENIYLVLKLTMDLSAQKWIVLCCTWLWAVFTNAHIVKSLRLYGHPSSGRTFFTLSTSNKNNNEKKKQIMCHFTHVIKSDEMERMKSQIAKTQSPECNQNF